MRVRWIADARVLPGVGMVGAGRELELEDAMAGSLIEQGKAEAIAERPVSAKAAAAPRVVISTPKGEED